MSSSTAIPISPDLKSAFDNAGGIRFIVVRIVNEVLIKAATHPHGNSLQADWGQISSVAGNTACYILVKVESRKWVTITFVPETTSVRDKMIYAATKSTLLNHLGYQYFADDLHANNKEELSWENYQGSLKICNPKTASEEIIDLVNRDEAAERKFRAERESVRGIGGYHSVSMPFDNSANDLVRGIVQGSYNFVELMVNAAKNGITGGSGKNVSGSYSSVVNTSEPRYYLIKSQGRNVFIYCCPQSSPQKLRMVYSTAKGSALSSVKALGFNANQTGEISDASEITEAFLRECGGSPHVGQHGPTRASRLPTDGTVKANRQSVISNAHPVYSLMGGNTNRAKKIVLPPPGAY